MTTAVEVPHRRWWPTTPWREILVLVAGPAVAAVGFLYAVAVIYVAGLLSLTVVGLPVLAAGLRGARGAGELHRRVANWALGDDLAPPRALGASTGIVSWIRAAVSDGAAWRTLGFLVVRLPVSVIGLVGVAAPLGYGLGFVTFAFWWSVLTDEAHTVGVEILLFVIGLGLLAIVPWAVRVACLLQAWSARFFLARPMGEAQVESLSRARATVLDQATHAREQVVRDLHDGTQSQLVSIAMDLAMAAEAADDGRAEQLIARARAQTDEALVDLRRLTSGLDPTAFAHSLGTALHRLSARSPIPVETVIDLAAAAQDEIERALYFAAAELLTNVAKHSGATAATLRLERHHQRLQLIVADDGNGGIDPAGSGLTGLAARLAALDGSLHIDSPPDGPTVVSVTVPIEL